MRGGKGLIVMVIPVLLAVRGEAGTVFDTVQETTHSLAVKAEESCPLCHAPDHSATDAPLWNQGTPVRSYRLSSIPASLPPAMSHPFGPSTTCLACHDGALAVDVHGIASPATSAGKRPLDHPDSVLYPRKPNGMFITPETAAAHIARYWSVPDRHGNNLTMPTGQTSQYLEKGTDPADPVVAASVVRTTEGRVHCDSCHNPHSNTYPAFLRASPKTLCLICHDR